jgi:hypothetical protein
MARWDSHLRRLEMKLRRLEQRRAHNKISEALRLYGHTKRMPKNPFLLEWVERFKTATEMMAGTMPGPHPEPPGHEPHPDSKEE